MSKSVKVPCLNTVTIAGQLVARPYQVKTKDDVGSLFNVAVTRHVKGKKPTTTFVDVICWGSLAESANRRLDAGDAVLVTGSLQNHNRKSDSGATAVLQVAAANVQFLTTNDGSLDDCAD